MYYVDKTASVAGLIRDMMHGHQLVTAPHGFGKSLMMSAVDAFLNIDYRGNIWFDRLDISEEHDLDIHRNAYPVVSMDLSRVDPEDIEGLQDLIIAAANQALEQIDKTNQERIGAITGGMKLPF